MRGKVYLTGSDILLSCFFLLTDYLVSLVAELELLLERDSIVYVVHKKTSAVNERYWEVPSSVLLILESLVILFYVVL